MRLYFVFVRQVDDRFEVLVADHADRVLIFVGQGFQQRNQSRNHHFFVDHFGEAKESMSETTLDHRRFITGQVAEFLQQLGFLGLGLRVNREKELDSDDSAGELSLHIQKFINDRNHLILDLSRTHFGTDDLETVDSLVTDHGLLFEAKLSEESDHLALELRQKEIKG